MTLTLKTAQVDDLIRFPEAGLTFRVQARSRRFIIATRPFAPKKTVLYTVVDLKRNWRGPDDRLFCEGYETREQCQARLRDLVAGRSEVSTRRGMPLDETIVKRPAARSA